MPARFPSSPLIEFIFASVLGLVAVTGVNRLDARWSRVSYWRAQQADHEDSRPSSSPVLESIGGVEADGRSAVLLDLPAGVNRFVAFVIHADALNQDLALWEQVKHRLAVRNDIELVAYCDGLPCVRALRQERRNVTFPVVGFAEYHTARVMLRADLSHNAVILDSGLRSLGTLRWSGRSDPADLAVAIYKSP